MAGVAEQVEGLDAAAGAQVERPVHRPAHRQLRQAQGRLPDSQDVVAAQHAGALMGTQVAGHPERGGRGVPFSADAVWPQVDGGAQRIVPACSIRDRAGVLGPGGRRFHEAQAEEPGNAGARERTGEVRCGQVGSDEPQGDGGGHRARLCGRGFLPAGEDGRHELFTSQRIGCLFAEEGGHAVDGVVHGGQVGRQLGQQGGVVTVRGIRNPGEAVHRFSLWAEKPPRGPRRVRPRSPPGSGAWRDPTRSRRSRG